MACKVSKLHFSSLDWVVICITVCCIIQKRTRSSASLCILAKFTRYDSRGKKTASLCDKFVNNIMFKKKTSAKLRLPLTTNLFVKDQNKVHDVKWKRRSGQKNRFASTAVVALSKLLHTNVNAIFLFPPPCCKRSLY